MQTEAATFKKLLSADLMDLMIRVGLVAILVVVCLRIIAPFGGVVLWALILAIALYPVHQSLARRLGGRSGRAATVLVVAGLLLIGIPTIMLGTSFAGHIQDTYRAFENNAITIEQPDASVADWPLVGKKVYGAWSAAAENLPGFLKQHEAQLKDLSKRALSAAASSLGGVLLFLGALIIAGIMMAFGESGGLAILRIFNRVAGSAKGPQLHRLSIATVRSVATGVIGVAAIQALLLGVGFIMAGVPAAGLLAFIVLFLGIMQLPALLVSLPVVAYIWWAGDGSTAVNVFYTVYLLLAGAADNVLKPLLLGRGVDAPMPVILLGALGGMVTGGFLGLFFGAVILAVGYQLFMEWVAQAEGGPGPESVQAEGDAEAPAAE